MSYFSNLFASFKAKFAEESTPLRTFFASDTALFGLSFLPLCIFYSYITYIEEYQGGRKNTATSLQSKWPFKMKFSFIQVI